MPFSPKAATPPPVKRAAKPKAAKAPTAKQQEREESVSGVLQTAGLACIVTGNLADAGALGIHGPKVAHELAKVAEDSEPLGNVLDYLTKVGPYTGLVLAVMPLAFQIAVNHGIGNASTMAQVGVVPPETLAVQVQADMVRQQTQAMQEKAAADEELRRLMSDTPIYDDMNSRKTSV